MITSRRSFLRSLGAGTTAAGIAVHWPLSGISRAATFEPSRPRQDDGLIRLHSNENAYGPFAKVAEVINSSIGSANRYPRMEYSGLMERIAVRPQGEAGAGAPRLWIHRNSPRGRFRVPRQWQAADPGVTDIRSPRTTPV